MKSILYIAACLLPVSAWAQSTGEGSHHTINSEVFGKEREIKLYISDAIAESDDAHPVLFVFDAQFEPYWDLVANTVNYLSAVDQFPHVIIVGICTEHRPKEFTPEPIDERTKKRWDDTPLGGASVLSEHIRSEVMPFLEERYNVFPLRMAIGHSLGGTYVSNSVFDKEGLFHAVISVSPNMAYDYGALPAKLADILEEGKMRRAWHFAGAGTVGDMENLFRRNALVADSIYRANPHPNLIWDFRVYEGLNHMNSPIHVISEGLAAFNEFWNISEEEAMAYLSDTSATYVSQLQAHYQKLNEWIGTEYPLSADMINTLGYTAAYSDDWNSALGVIEWGLSAHPDDPNLSDSKGECLENLGDMEGALASYTRALEVLESVKERYSAEDIEYYEEIFKLNKDRATAALKDAK
ncbi:MAG: hypothetical protein LC670_14620 [Flavobacteriales bacterium]|nr:hypothetical protein [Flavobacteriales bacterium]